MMRRNNITFDTCGCKVQFEWDDELAEPDYSPVKIIKICEIHASIAQGIDALQNLWETTWVKENQGKNNALRIFLAELPPEEKRKVQPNEPILADANGDTFKTQPDWYFDESRKLVIEHPTLSDAVLKEKVTTVINADYPELLSK